MEGSMTYVLAQLIVHNPDAYTREQVGEAVAIILSDLTASDAAVSFAMLAV